jgi:glycosyltransferase involved in cell wall biosynthesis
MTVVLHLRSSGFVGGPEKQILAQARELAAYGCRVFIGSFLQNDEGVALLSAASQQHVDTLAFRCRGPWDLSPPRQIAAAVSKHGISLICAHDPKASLLGYLAARRAKVAFVAWSRGWTRQTWRVRAYESVHRMLLRRAHLVVAVSKAEARRCHAAGVPSERLRVIPNAVDADPPARSPTASLRRELGLSAQSLLALSVGRLSREKGQRFLVDAASMIVRACPDAYVVILGEGPERQRLEQRRDSLGLRDRVLLPGFRSGAAGLMGEADLVVLPSLTEGLPNVVLEAFASGVAIVATHVGGVPELVRDGETGWLVAPSLSDELARAVIDALGNPAERRRRGDAGRQLVRQYYTFPAQAAQTVAAFRDVILSRSHQDAATA